MTLFEKIRWKWGIWFQGWCIDHDCDGVYEIYDDKPWRVSCDKCGAIIVAIHQLGDKIETNLPNITSKYLKNKKNPWLNWIEQPPPKRRLWVS